MERLPDWPERLHKAVAEALATPFAWGDMDCVGFAAKCVEACRGKAPKLPKWTDEKSARRAMAKEGGLAEGLAKRFEELPSVAQAGTGDLGIFEHANGAATVVVCMGVSFMGMDVAGPVIVARQNVKRAFRV